MSASDMVGAYRLLSRVARGGMAEVWRARAPDGREVCLKRLDPSLKNDVDFIEMFKDEASLVLDFDHPNIVKMYELIDDGDELAMVLEFVDGPSLARVRSALETTVLADVREGFGVQEALQIGIYLCRALHHAHTRTRYGEPLRIVHRDVSPQNVLLCSADDPQRSVRLVDFGIAKATQRLTHTRSGALKGKCSYMAPEQVRGESVDHRADQFATGILLWEMLTGRRLFGGRNEVLILQQVARSDAVPPSSVKATIPKAVDRVVLRALGWHPDERYADMADLERALQTALDGIAGERGRSVDLEPLVARTNAAVAQQLADGAVAAENGAAQTRVMALASTKERDDGSDDDDDDSPLVVTDPLAHPQHTGQFFEAPSLKRASRRVVGVGAVLLAAAVGVAIVPLPKRATPSAVVVVTQLADTPAPVTVLDTLDATLRALPSHPCRTELLEDLLDYHALSVDAQQQLERSVAQCKVDVLRAPSLRARAILTPPAWPKRKAHTGAVLQQHVAELLRRGNQAMVLGDYEAAKRHFVEAIDLQPQRVAVHGKLGSVLRGLGDAVGAGYHARLFLHAFANDVDRERITLYLKRYRQATQLDANADPSTQEREVRVYRLLVDSQTATDRVPLLMQAHALLPRSVTVLERLGEAHSAQGQLTDAKAAFEQALAIAPSKRLRAKIKQLGN